MKIETKIRVLIATIAAICCAVPLLLFSVGLGSLGIGAFTEKYSLYFVITGIIILIVALYLYLKKRRPRNKQL